MNRKTLQVQVELEIQAVTCPGVWLCPNGHITLQMHMLDSCIQTAALRPIFPLLYNEKFIFYKEFDSARNLSDLQRFLNRECLYAELIQWQHCEGNLLASFQSCLGDILYPSTYDGALTGIDVDLLMEPSKNFPGIIAPKIEVNTRTTIEEIVSKTNNDKCNTFVVNPKVVPSDQITSEFKHTNIHQQKVCHSIPYHKSRKCTRTQHSKKPMFLYRKVDDKLISRKPELFVTSESQCNCCNKDPKLFTNRNILSEPKSNNMRQYQREFYNKCKRSLRIPCPNGTQMCLCGSGHIQGECPVCRKYNRYIKEENFKNFGSKEACLLKVSPCRLAAGDTGSPHSETYGNRSFVIKTKPALYCSCVCSPTSDTKTCNKMCCVLEQKKPSLAEQIHNRIKRTFDCASSYVYDSGCESPIDCGCSKLPNCKHRLYKSLGKLHKELQKC